MTPEDELAGLILKDMEEWLFVHYFKKEYDMYEYLDEIERKSGKGARSQALSKLTESYWQNHLGL